MLICSTLKSARDWIAGRNAGGSTALPHLLYRWEQHPNQNSDDGDNDQGFNSGETVHCTLGLIRDIFHVFLQYFRFSLLQFRNQLEDSFVDGIHRLIRWVLEEYGY